MVFSLSVNHARSARPKHQGIDRDIFEIYLSPYQQIPLAIQPNFRLTTFANNRAPEWSRFQPGGRREKAYREEKRIRYSLPIGYVNEWKGTQSLICERLRQEMESTLLTPMRRNDG